MWFAFADRRLFLDLIGSKDPDKTLKLRFEKQIPSISGKKDEMVLLWRDKPNKRDFLPEIIAVKQHDMRDFLAWTSTYLSALRPLTAYCRILEIEQAKDLIYKEQKPSLGNMRDAFVGVIIGEVLSHHYNDDLMRITPISIKSTYSYVMARACAMGHEKDFLENVTKRWNKARELSQQPKRKITTDTIEQVWKMLKILNLPWSEVESNSLSSIILDACIDISKIGAIDDAKWMNLTKDLPGMKEVIAIMLGTKEQRVEWFENITRMLQDNSSIDQTMASFLCGYLLSQVTRGSMQHAGLLRPYLGKFPTIVIWYGLCAGLYENTGIYNELDGLGSRILRDLQEEFNIAERPKADIAFEELEVLFGAEKIDKKFIQENHSYLTIELLPGLHTVVRWPPSEDNGIEKEDTRKEIKKLEQYSDNQRTLFESGRGYSKDDVLKELGETLRKAQYLCDRIHKEYYQPTKLPSKGYSKKDYYSKRRGKS